MLDGDRTSVVSPCHYVAGDHCFYTVDVSNPAAPALLGSAVHDVWFGRGYYQSLNASPSFSHLSVHEERLYLSNQWGGVAVIDVADPTHPVSLTELWTHRPALV